MRRQTSQSRRHHLYHKIKHYLHHGTVGLLNKKTVRKYERFPVNVRFAFCLENPHTLMQTLYFPSRLFGILDHTMRNVHRKCKHTFSTFNLPPTPDKEIIKKSRLP